MLDNDVYQYRAQVRSSFSLRSVVHGCRVQRQTRLDEQWFDFDTAPPPHRPVPWPGSSANGTVPATKLSRNSLHVRLSSTSHESTRSASGTTTATQYPHGRLPTLSTSIREDSRTITYPAQDHSTVRRVNGSIRHVRASPRLADRSRCMRPPNERNLADRSAVWQHSPHD